MTRAVREIRLLGETNLTEAQKEILSLARNFDVMRGWMLASRIMLENPAAMERMEFPRWFPSAGRDGERLWTAAPDKAAGAFWQWRPCWNAKLSAWKGRRLPHCG